jgi:hypothetical protein
VILLLASVALARPKVIYWEEGRLTDALVVRFREPVRREEGRFIGPGDWTKLDHLVGRARVRPVAATLPHYYRVDAPDAEVLATELLDDPRVEDVWLAFAPMPPPEDLPPTTDDFRDEETWLDAFPGLGFSEAARWPGGRGDNVRVADIEYSWDPTHEDLDSTIGAGAWGLDTETYRFHGNSVLGELVGGDNGYGIVGGVPDAAPMVISPYRDDGVYDVAAAIAAATERLAPGDVLLIEQQAWANGGYCPIEVDPAVYAAITDAVAAGIVVVEPGANGGLDLDDPMWEGWFDRDHDSGAILVGGGASPASDWEPRAWSPNGSSYGARVDVQGWYDGIATATSGEYGSSLADLYYPDDDGRQAYTRSFSGTSGAAPMIAAMAAVAQSVSIAVTGEPWTPDALRAALVASGSPQQGVAHVGPQPDLRRLLRTWFVP